VAGWVESAALEQANPTSSATMMMMMTSGPSDGDGMDGRVDAPASFGSPASGTLAAGAMLRSGPSHPAWGQAVQDTPVVALASTDHPGWLVLSELPGITDIVRTEGERTTYDAWVDARDAGFEGQPPPASCSQADPEGRPCQHPPRAFSANGVSQIDLPQGTYADSQRDVAVSSFVTMASPVTQSMLHETMGSTPSSADCPDCPAYGVPWEQVVLYANALSEQHGLQPAYSWSEFSEPASARWRRDADGWRVPTRAEWHYTREYCTALQGSLQACDDPSVAEWIWRYPAQDAPGWQVDPDGGGLGSMNDALGLNEDGTVWHLPSQDAVIGLRLVRSSP